MHPATLSMLKHFDYEDKPSNLLHVMKPIQELAQNMAQNLPGGPEKSAGLRKLMEARDCFERAAKEQ